MTLTPGVEPPDRTAFNPCRDCEGLMTISITAFTHESAHVNSQTEVPSENKGAPCRHEVQRPRVIEATLVREVLFSAGLHEVSPPADGLSPRTHLMQHPSDD